MIISDKHFTEERALFCIKNTQVKDCEFSVGESPFKHSENLQISNCKFISRYPVWYSKHIEMENCFADAESRAGIWYTDDITLRNCTVEAPKSIRRVSGITVDGCSFPYGDETLWHCSDITVSNTSVCGDYFFMNSKNAQISGLNLNGKYSFDGAENVVIRNSTLISKDAFWNSRNITVYDSLIVGEYIGWNAENLTLINCTLESLQGFCYIKNLVMKGCKTKSTSLAFEYSSLDVELDSGIDSVINPTGGKIVAHSIGELTLEPEHINPENTEIIIKTVKP